jgi:hypothetical protein
VNLAREWTVFGGASLVLMGIALCAGARRHAEDAAAWQRQWRQAVGAPDSGADESGSLVAVYRVGGALVALAGAALLGGTAAGRALSSTRFGPGDARALGACFAALGLGFAVLKLSRLSPRGPRFLAADPLVSGGDRPLGERVAGAATWTLCALWTGFGLRLLTESLR